MALTVGIGTVMDAKEVVVVVSGQSKALALHMCIEEATNHMWTVSALQQHPHPLIVCDEDATAELKVKTVRYFKSLEFVTKQLEAGAKGFRLDSVPSGIPDL